MSIENLEIKNNDHTHKWMLSGGYDGEVFAICEVDGCKTMIDDDALLDKIFNLGVLKYAEQDENS